MNKEKRKGTFKAFAAGLLSAAMLVTSSSCGQKQTGPAETQSGGKIAVITKQQLSFWDDVKKGAQDAGDEFGYEIMYTVADGDNDYVSQIAAINDAINKKVDAIVIAPNSETELNEALTKAIDNGIKVVTINSSLDNSMLPKIVSAISSSDTDGGVVAAKNAVSAFVKNGGDLANIGKIGIVGHTAGTAEERISGFIDRMTESIADAKGIEIPEVDNSAAMAAAMAAAMGGAAAAQGGAEGAGGAQGGPPTTTMPVTTAPVETTTTIPFEQLSEIEQAHYLVDKETEAKKAEDARQLDLIKKNFVQSERCARVDEAKDAAKKLLGDNGNGISIMYATNTNTTLGVCAAVEELGLTGKVTVVGFNSDEEELAYIRRGVLDGTIIQNPYIMGYVGVRYAKQAINEQGVSKMLDTGVTYVNAGNMNEDYIQLLLYPDKF